ncbi:MAG: hypothetical protein ACRES9_11850 [Gammaproteobacteria bacterium]
MTIRPATACVFVLASLFAGAPAIAAAAQCPSHVDVRDTMTVHQFDQAGLDKLSKQELAALNAWLSRYIQRFCAKQSVGAPPSRNVSAHGGAGNTTANPRQQSPSQTSREHEQAASAATTQAQAANFGAPPKQKAEQAGHIESRIVGDFHGWTGNTVFRLKNGQVWKQAGPGYFRIDLKNPKVVIKKLLIGYVLKVEGYGKEVFVRRTR